MPQVLADPVAAFQPIPRKRPHSKCAFQWVPTDGNQLAHVEQAILSKLGVPFVMNRLGGIHCISTDVATVEVANPPLPPKGGAQPRHHIVLLHGFGGGLATWLPNYRAIVQELAATEERYHTTVHAIDMPGFGRSERKWRHIGSDAEAIGFMVDGVKRWMDAAGISDGEDTVGGCRVTLLGHSFGAYVSAQVAMRYPRIVLHIILADPWGVNRAVSPIKKLPLTFRIAKKLFYAVLPFSILRGAGPLGPKLLPKVRKDFADRWAPFLDSTDDFYDYVYHCNASSTAVGELAFQQCCHGMACARSPLVDSMPSRLRSAEGPGCLVTVLYGANSWMDKTAGRETYDALPVALQCGFHIIPNAGHQVASDNAPDFNRVVVDALRTAAAIMTVPEQPQLTVAAEDDLSPMAAAFHDEEPLSAGAVVPAVVAVVS